ncbi:LLM class flavin-dependent oxidoreductase [Actinomadura sp. 7K507]|uniref:LLM class flavin-dependent oxidoreductase n=1 Tax=Actinomadura sp. 7K507 TaxID=2530365 RepID=UPI00104F2451|nr:LLM class flavin-dependent oxidoreductase [Actinomadura sp. 7K507]TDC98443.1 LLM class flavin-dependent oxidoreductase [Actinomadura sp. 7K507]
MTRLGLSIASHSGLPPERIAAVAADAERAGFGDVFIAEGHGDALGLCHPVVAATTRAGVGTAITNAALRPPVLTAKAAVDLDEASGGRFRLGLGTANAVMNGRAGLPPHPPLTMIEEYVSVVRAVLSGDPAGFTGKIFQVGQVPLDRPPRRPDMPIHLGALGPRMQALAGRIADGVILNLMSPAQAAEAVATVRAAARDAGRDPAAVEITCVVHYCPSDDPETAAEAARQVVPRYVLHPAVGRLFGAEHEEGLAAARERAMTGDRAGAAAHVPQPVADAFVAHGTAADCAVRLQEYRDAGVDLPVVFPMPVEGRWDYETVIQTPGLASGPAFK